MSKKPPDSTPSLREIAREAGVALSTASCALRGKPGVSAATIANVRAVAERMGWRVNPLVSAWLTHVRGLRKPADFGELACVVASKLGMETYLTHPKSRVYGEYLLGAREQAERQGYHLEAFDYFALGPSRLTKVLRSRNIQGMILAPDSERTLDIEWQHFAVVEISHSIIDPPLHRVANHHFLNTKRCVENLRRLGYRKIGLALTRWADMRTEELLSGGYYAGILNTPGTEYLNPYMPDESQVGRNSFLRWLRSAKPDAVITGSANICEWIEEWNAGKKQPMVIAHIDKHPAQNYTRNLGGINRHPRRLGAAAVDLLTYHVEHNERGTPAHPKILLFEGEWVDGDSTPAMQG